MPLNKLSKSPSTVHLLSDFITNGCWICQMLLLHLLRILCAFFLLYSINEENYTDSFSNMKLNLFTYLHTAGFDLLIFYSGFLCLCSWGILVCNFLDLMYVLKGSCWLLYWEWTHQETSLEAKRPIGRDWSYPDKRASAILWLWASQTTSCGHHLSVCDMQIYSQISTIDPWSSDAFLVCELHDSRTWKVTALDVCSPWPLPKPEREEVSWPP